MSLIVEGPIFQEAEVLKTTPNKAVFRMVMQTANEVNQNNRVYPIEVLSKGMENCKARMERRAFYGELDHPVPSQNERADGVRQTTVLLANTSHIIRDFEFQKNNLVGELETLSTDKGKILLALLKDKTGVGLSMRGMAELKVQEFSEQQNVNVVQDPLLVITYDGVSLPSHGSAVVNYNEMKFESMECLTENASSGTICTPDGQCFLIDYFDKLVETGMIKFEKNWV